MVEDNNKMEMSVLVSGSLRGIADKVNELNSNGSNITRDDIVTLYKDEDAFYLVYFK